jgi:hypothetical protein
MQSYLSIFALVLTTLLAVMLYSWVSRTYDYGYYVDTVQEMRAVNIDLLDYLATIPFDERTDTTGVIDFDTPQVASELTSPGSFGGNCQPFVTCGDLDDYHGKTIRRTLSWFDIETRIEVVYVSVDDPKVESGTQSFAKEVRLFVSSPYLRTLKPDLPDVRIGRVYTYFHQQSPPSAP